VYDARTGQDVLAIKGSAGLSPPVFSPDGTRVAVCPLPNGGDGVLRVYDARTGQEALAIKGPERLCNPVFSPDGTRIAVGPELTRAGEGVVRVYDARTGQGNLIIERSAPRLFAACSPDGTRVAVTNGHGVVRVYDAQTGREVLTITGPAGLYSPLFSPDGARIAMSADPGRRGGDGVLRVYDVRTGRETLTLKRPAGLYDPAFSPDGARIAAANGGRVVRVYDARTGREVLTITGPAGLRSPVFSPDGTRIAMSPDQLRVSDGKVRVYDALTGREVLALKGPAELYDPAFSPDGTRVAVVSSDGVVRVYDAGTGQETLTLKGPAELYDPVFSPDGARIAVVSKNFGVRVCDAQTGQEVLALPASDVRGSLIFSPDGSRLADLSGRVWTAPHNKAAWQTERGTALVDSLAAWHRARADESERNGDLFAAKFHLDHRLALRPDDAPARRRRAHVYVQSGQWPQAAADFGHAFPREPIPDLELGLEHAAVCLLTGDKDGYRRLREFVLKHTPAKSDPRMAYLMARLCAIDPDSRGDLEVPMRLMQQALAKEPSAGWHLHTLGLLHYRAGRYEEAARQFHKALAEDPTWMAHVLNHLGLALAYHRLGKADEAQKWWREAKRWADENARDPAKQWSATLPLHPHDWLGCLLLRREAEALLKEPPPDPKK
jgi:WD40 repeat protein/Flp pilus assembly protein TadD